MSLWRQLSRGLSVLAHRSRADQEIDAELQHYLDEATDAYVGKGLSGADARRAARREIGSPAAARERVRDSGWENVIVTALADLRFGGRMLRKNPLFTFVVVFVIALGCGGVTTVFSGMNAIVLRPVPGVASAAALVTLRPARGDGRVADQGSYNLYSYLRAHSRTLDAVGAWGRVSLTIAADGRGAAVIGNMVSANYFDALGIRPARGRFFAANEDQERGAHPVIVVSHGFWQAHLHGDPAAVGRLISVNRMPFTLIGIAPHDFRGIYTGLRIDAWVPLAMPWRCRAMALRTVSALSSGFVVCVIT